MRRFWLWLNGPPQHRRGARALRTICGVYLVFFALQSWRDSSAIWGPHGLAVPARGSNVAIRVALALEHVVFSSDVSTLVFLGIITAAGLALVMDVTTWPAVLVGYSAMTILAHRFPMLQQGDHTAARLVLGFLLLITPRRAAPGSWRAFIHNIGITTLIGNIAIAYCIAGLSKASGQTWQHGIALAFIDHSHRLATPAFRLVTANRAVTSILTYAVLLWELWFPIAIATPLRIAWILSGIVLEGAIGITMHLMRFAIIMIGWLLVLPSDHEYEAALKAARRLLGAITQAAWPQHPTPVIAVYLDMTCTACSAAGRIILALDPGRAIDIRSLDNDVLPEGVTRDEAARAMVAIELSSGIVTHGFRAVRTVTAHAALLRPLTIVLWLIDRVGLGDRFYKYIAAHRHTDVAVCSVSRH